MVRATLFLLSLFVLLEGAHAQDKCPEPVVQVTRDVKGKIDAQVSTLLKLGKIKGEGDIETITKDVLHSYPNSDRLALEQNTLSVLCNMVLPSPDYSKEFKQKIIEKMVEKLYGDLSKPNPLDDIETAISPGRASINFARSILGVARTEDIGIAIFPKNELVVGVEYYTKRNFDRPPNTVRAITIRLDGYFRGETTTAVRWYKEPVRFGITTVGDVFKEVPERSSCKLKVAKRKFFSDLFYLQCFERAFITLNNKQVTKAYDLISLYDKAGFCNDDKPSNAVATINALNQYISVPMRTSGCFDPMWTLHKLESEMVRVAMDATIWALQFYDYGAGAEFDLEAFEKIY
jgi:hypothetical protein